MPFDQLHPRRLFIWTLGLTLLLKCFLAVWFPLTGDEAFFYQWGQAPALGFADHPPMVGWWLALLGFFSDHIGVGRLAPVFLTAFTAVGIVDTLRRLLPLQHQSNAWWMGTIYLVMPWSWMFFLVTTDTPLVFFMTLSAWLFVRGETSASTGLAWRWFAAAGVTLGLAFLSKYFAVLLGVAFAVYIAGWRRDRWWALMLVIALAMPSVAVHLHFNAHHGWQNVMFNFFNRHEKADWGFQNALVYALMLLYLFTPWLVYQAVKHPSIGDQKTRRLVLVLLTVPLLMLLLVSAKRSVGLHWVLGFVSFFMVWSGFSLSSTQRLAAFFKWTLWLSLPHLLLLWALAGAPLQWWAQSSQYEKLVFLRHADQITQTLTTNLPDSSLLMSTAYSPASVLAYHHKRYVPVFGLGRHYARQDDLVVDFRELQGKNIRIFNRSPMDVSEFEPFFDEIKVHEFQLSGVSFYWLDGTGFNYSAYRERVLMDAASQFHDIPKWLPLLGNPFCERYGFVECAPAVGTSIVKPD